MTETLSNVHHFIIKIDSRLTLSDDRVNGVLEQANRPALPPLRERV